MRAVNPSGASDWAVASVSLPAAAPSALAASNVRARSLTLTWTDETSLETAYVVERALDAATPAFAVLARLAPDTTRYDDATVEPDTAYVYRVGTEGPGGTPSTTVSVRTPPLPVAPVSLLATGLSSNRVQLAWVDSQPGVTAYEIERSTGAAAFTRLAVVGAGVSTYIDESATAETSYTYRLRAVDAAGESDWSNESSVETAPLAPADLRVTSATAAAVTLAWTDRAARETEYRVERADVAGGPFAVLATLAADASSYVDGSVSPAAAYLYRVVVKGAGGESSLDLPYTVPALPNAPTALVATAPTPTRVRLTWTDAQSGLLLFELERAVGTGAFASLSTAPAGLKTYDDDSVAPETDYRYRVRAVSAAGDSAYSTEATVTTPPPPPTLQTPGTSAVLPADCSALFEAGTTADGLYTIDPDGAGPHAPFETYCDMTNGGWTLVFDQDIAVGASLPTREAWAAGLATTAPNGGQWSALDRMGAFANSAGSYELRLTYGQSGAEYQQWVQTWNPMLTTRGTISNVSGSPANQRGCGEFVGLAADGGGDSLLDADVDGCWFFAVGAVNLWSDGTQSAIPVFASADGRSGYATDRMRMWVRHAAVYVASSTATRVDLVWSDNAQRETAYTVERANGTSSSYVPLATLPADTHRYSDTTVRPSTTYTYRVTAVGPGGSSSGTVTVTTPTPPPAPTGLSAQMDGSYVKVRWTAPVAGVLRYELDRAIGSGAFASLGSVAGALLEFVDVTAPAESLVRYRVRATTTSGVSASSSAVAVTTPPAAPTDLAAATPLPTRNDLTWTDNARSEWSYRVERADAGTTAFAALATLAPDTTSYSDTTIAATGSYLYRVSAVGTGGFGSTVLEVAPPADRCAFNSGGCGANAACAATTAGVVTCTCNNGFTGDGVTCDSCTDGVKNGLETATDCGGGCGGCALGAACAVNGDCTSNVCTAGLCDVPPPTCTDGLQNGTETGKDCGGNCGACAYLLRRMTEFSGTYVSELGTAGFDTSGTFTVPAGISRLSVYVLGGGGGGRNDFSTPGGGGGAAQRSFTVTPGQQIAFTVGAGGGNSADGNDSVVTIGAVTLVGGGGKSDGRGGVATGGSVNVPGGSQNGVGGNVGGVCSAGAGGSAINDGEGKFAPGRPGGCWPAGSGGNGPPQYPVSSPGLPGAQYGGGGGAGGNYNGQGGAGAGGYVRFAWDQTFPNAIDNWGIVLTQGAQINTSQWPGITTASVVDGIASNGDVAYSLSFDGRKTFVANTQGAWRKTVRSITTNTVYTDVPLWQFNSATDASQETWTDCADNSVDGCLSESFNVPANGMRAARVIGLTASEWAATGGFVPGTLDYAVGVYSRNPGITCGFTRVTFGHNAASCRELYAMGTRTDGNYTVDPARDGNTQAVYCDMQNGGMTFGSEATQIAAGYYELDYGDSEFAIPSCPISSTKVYPIEAAQAYNCESGIYTWTAPQLSCLVNCYSIDASTPATIGLRYFGDGQCADVGDRCPGVPKRHYLRYRCY